MCDKEENNNIQKSMDLVLNENSRMKRKYDQISQSVEISYNDETGIKKKIKLDNNSNISIELDKGSDKNFNTKNKKNDVQILPHTTMSKREFTVIKTSNIIEFYNDQQHTGIVNERFKSSDAITKSNIVCSKISNFKSDFNKLSKIIKKENCVLKSLAEKQEKSKTSTEQYLTNPNSNMKMNSISCQTIRSPLLSIEFIKDDVKALEFFTGLQSFEKFLYAFKLLGPDAYDLHYYYPIHEISLSTLDQFFMTLVILKLHKSHYEISVLFKISLRDIKNIFITWIRFMQLEWRHLKLPKGYQPKISLVKSIIGDKKHSVESDNSATNMPIHDKVTPVINLVSEEVSDNFKKVYKILNGPDNYMEKHLMGDIIFVCHVLCYFRVKRISTLHPIIKSF